MTSRTPRGPPGSSWKRVRSSELQLGQLNEPRDAASSEERELQRFSVVSPPASSVSATETEEAGRKIPTACSFTVLKSILSMSWSNLGDKGCRDNRDAFREQAMQLGLVNSLLLGVAAGAVFSGNFVVFQKGIEYGTWMYLAQHVYLFVWCAAFLTFLYAMLISIILHLAASETNTEAQFIQFEDQLGPFWSKLPYIMLNLGTLLVWLGLIAFVTLTYHFKFMLCCLAICSTFIVLFDLCVRKMASSLHVIHMSQDEVDDKRSKLSADDIYNELHHYWKNELSEDFSRLSRREFLDRFYTTQSESIHLLASAIYDDWLNKRIKSMVREDPGF